MLAGRLEPLRVGDFREDLGEAGVGEGWRWCGERGGEKRGWAEGGEVGGGEQEESECRLVEARETRAGLGIWA